MIEAVRENNRLTNYSYPSLEYTAPICKYAECYWHKFLEENERVESFPAVIEESLFDLEKPDLSYKAPMIQKDPHFGERTYLVVAGPWTGFIAESAEHFNSKFPEISISGNIMVKRHLLPIPYFSDYSLLRNIKNGRQNDFVYINEMSRLLRKLVPIFDQAYFMENVFGHYDFEESYKSTVL